MSNEKLDPRSLREKAEALVTFTREGPLFIAWVQAVTDALEPASKPAKVECPNCLQPEEHPHFAGNLTGDGGWYFCPGRVPQAADKRKPSQPELSGHDSARSGQPASEGGKVECENCGEDVCRELEHQFHKSFEHGERWTCKPAQPDTSTVDVGMQCLGCGDTEPTCRCEGYSPEPVAEEMPEAVRNAVNSLRACAVTARYPAILTERADALESFWRARSEQPEPAVAMTEELEVVLRLAAQHVEGWRQTYQSPEYRKQMLSAIAAVRAQAAEAGKVRMPKVRELLRSLVMECKLANSNPLSANVNPYILAPKLDAALAELDAVEGRK